MWLVRDDEVDGLLTREARMDVSFARLLLLYLYPFALLKSYSPEGPPSARKHAVAHNRSVRWILPLYIRRWTVIGATLGLVGCAAGALARTLPAFAAPAEVCGFGSCFAVFIVAMTAVVHLGLVLNVDFGE